MRMPRSAGFICRARRLSLLPLRWPTDPSVVVAHPGEPAKVMPLIAQAQDQLVRSCHHDAHRARIVKAPRIMSKYYHAILDRLIARGLCRRRAPVRLGKAAKMLILRQIRFYLKV